MHFHLVIHPDAAVDLDAIVTHIAAESPQNAGLVADRLADGIRSLNRFPRRGRTAREADQYDLELRQFIVFPYRVIYAIEGKVVHILRIVHGHRDDLSPEQLPPIEG